MAQLNNKVSTYKTMACSCTRYKLITYIPMRTFRIHQYRITNIIYIVSSLLLLNAEVEVSFSLQKHPSIGTNNIHMRDEEEAFG